MAYLNYLVASSESQVTALCEDSTFLLHPSLVVAVSHLIGYWVEIQPLGQLLGQAVDGGELVNRKLWHPLRAPVFHTPVQVRALHQQLVDAWNNASGPQTQRSDWYWYCGEINGVLRAYRHASDNEECIVSVVQPPADEERRARVRIPFASVASENEAGPRL